MGRLVKHVPRTNPCCHDAPGPWRRWRENIDLGSKWECGQCGQVLILEIRNFVNRRREWYAVLDVKPEDFDPIPVPERDDA